MRLLPVGDFELGDAVARQHGEAGRRRVLLSCRQETVWQAMLEEYARLLAKKNLPVPTPRAGRIT